MTGQVEQRLHKFLPRDSGIWNGYHFLRAQGRGRRGVTQPTIRCAVHTRKSTGLRHGEAGLRPGEAGEGLDRDFNSLDAQREAAKAFDSRTAANFLCRAAAVLCGEGQRDQAIVLLKEAE